jgi:hypothetical protein
MGKHLYGGSGSQLPEMCRFCMASYLTLPFRYSSVEDSLIPAIERGLKVTNRLGLRHLSPSIRSLKPY